MFRTYQAVLQPTRRQAVALAGLLEAQQELYNAALEERRGAWRWERRSISRFEQFGALTGWDHPVLAFGVCPARGTVTRLDRAFWAFWRRCRAGETPGFPRFKSAARWDSVEYPDTGCWGVDQQRDGVGRLHLKAAQAVGRLHRKIARQRRDLAHRVSRRLVNRYDLIVHEDLPITNLVRRPAPRPNPEGGYEPNGAAAKAALNREILAAGWGQLLAMIGYKAEEAGRTVIAVNPRHTSQACAACGHVEEANRTASAFRCRCCGHSDHAARNIFFRAGLALRLEREADDAASTRG